MTVAELIRANAQGAELQQRYTVREDGSQLLCEYIVLWRRGPRDWGTGVAIMHHELGEYTLVWRRDFTAIDAAYKDYLERVAQVAT